MLFGTTAFEGAEAVVALPTSGIRCALLVGGAAPLAVVSTGTFVGFEFVAMPTPACQPTRVFMKPYARIRPAIRVAAAQTHALLPPAVVLFEVGWACAEVPS